MTTMTTVRDAILDLFRSHNLTTWFGNPGSSELALLQDFPDDFRYFLGLQEMIPVGMADAYAQITRRPAVVNLHTAPGMGNAQGQIYNAYVNKTPLIITAGNQRRNMQNQYCLLTNHEPTTTPKPFVKWAAEPAIASEAPAVLARAIHLATTPPMGPVFVSLPMDDMPVELTDEQLADIKVVRERTVTHATGFPAELAEQVAAQLDAATSPVIVVGGDIDRYDAYDAVTELAERIEAPVFTAPLTGWSGFPENHRLYHGALPPGAGWISQILTGHDLILTIGTAVFRYYPLVPGPYLPGSARLIQITNDPDEAARAPVGDAIVADIRTAAQALAATVKPTQRSAPAPRAAVPEQVSAQVPLKPEDLWTAVGHAAPDDTLWVSEAGSNEIPMTESIRPGNPLSHLSAAGGGLGWGLPASVGAQIAAPDRPVVSLMGDGSIHYAITALWSAARYNIPVTVVVASNAEYGVVKEFGVWEKTPNVPGLDIPGLDIVATAASYGVDAHEAHSSEEVFELVKAGIADRDRPTLINARTTPVSGGFGS
jgi:benzoylformate decarboxylase